MMPVSTLPRLLKPQVWKVASRQCLPATTSVRGASFHTSALSFEKVPEPTLEKEELKKEDKTERIQELKQTIEDAVDMRDVQKQHVVVKDSELQTVKASESDVKEVKIHDFIDDVLGDISMDQPEAGKESKPVRSSHGKESSFAPSNRGSSSKRFDQDSFRNATQTKFATGGSLDGRHISDKIKNHPKYDWALFRAHEGETEAQVLARLMQKFEASKRKYDEKRMSFFMKNQEDATGKKKKKKTIIENGWEDIAINNIVEFEAKLHSKNEGKIVKVQDLLYKDPVTNEEKASVTLIKNINPDMIPRVNPLLTQEYPAISYLHKDTLEELKNRLNMHMKSNDPLPEDLIPFKKIMDARGEKLQHLQDEQYLGKLVPISNRPLHLWEDISNTPMGKYRSQWKKKRMLLNKALRDRERHLKKLARMEMPEKSIESLDFRWRAVYNFYMNRLRNAVKPDGDWKEARENYRTIRSIFSTRFDLDENREHLELYLLGHAKYWDWNKAREIFMKKYKTLWNIHPEIRDNSLKPIFILMRGLAYRKRSFKEVLALHSLVADEAANGLLFEHAVPPKWYYDSVLACMIEEKQWDLAKQWFTQFYQSTLYAKTPSTTSHIIPDKDTYLILLKGAKLVPKVASVEAHMILDAARRDSIKTQSTFTLTPEMVKELMEAHLQDGDGAGASIVFKKSFETAFSTGPLSFFSLDVDQQKDFLYMYFRGLGQCKNMNEIYKSLTSLYRFDAAWMQDTAFHNRIMEDLANLNYSLGVHFLKTIFKINGKIHFNPVQPDFYTFESIMLRAVKNRRFMFARGLVNLVPPTIHGSVYEKLKNMSGLALRPANPSKEYRESV